MRKPMIAWEHDFSTDAFVCKVGIPREWLMENSHLKRMLQLWWWLTKLAWRLPK